MLVFTQNLSQYGSIFWNSAAPHRQNLRDASHPLQPPCIRAWSFQSKFVNHNPYNTWLWEIIIIVKYLPKLQQLEEEGGGGSVIIGSIHKYIASWHNFHNKWISISIMKFIKHKVGVPKLDLDILRLILKIY